MRLLIADGDVHARWIEVRDRTDLRGFDDTASASAASRALCLRYGS